MSLHESEIHKSENWDPAKLFIWSFWKANLAAKNSSIPIWKKNIFLSSEKKSKFKLFNTKVVKNYLKFLIEKLITENFDVKNH